MQKNHLNASELYAAVDQLYHKVLEERNQNYKEWQDKIKRPEFAKSAKNLMAYLALRTRDIRELQAELIPWGLTSLGSLESKVIPTIASVRATLAELNGLEGEHPPYKDFFLGWDRLEKNSEEIFTPQPANRYTRIMVTLDSATATDYDFVRKLVKNGMNVARINCSHDDPETWSTMIANVQRAGQELGLDVKVEMEISGPKIRTSFVYTEERNPKVKTGDWIRLCRDTQHFDAYPGMKLFVGLSHVNIFDTLKVGDPVLIDDGTVQCTVKDLDEHGATLYIDKVNGKALRVKSERSINFPNTIFDLDLISEKDRQDIAYVCQNADIIGFSFVKTPQDVEEIQAELRRNLGDKAGEMPIMLKIETVKAIDNLPSLILTAAAQNPLCVMIARGDLAVESGYIRLSELQQEIMWICEASDIPVVWATEVLANLVDTGIPTRAEITDAAESSRTECVMLNKGKYIQDGVKMLDAILEKMSAHQYKKSSLLRALHIAEENLEPGK
jgi:pyruvate kinase